MSEFTPTAKPPIYGIATGSLADMNALSNRLEHYLREEIDEERLVHEVLKYLYDDLTGELADELDWEFHHQDICVYRKIGLIAQCMAQIAQCNIRHTIHASDDPNYWYTHRFALDD